MISQPSPASMPTSVGEALRSQNVANVIAGLVADELVTIGLMYTFILSKRTSSYCAHFKRKLLSLTAPPCVGLTESSITPVVGSTPPAYGQKRITFDVGGFVTP